MLLIFVEMNKTGGKSKALAEKPRDASYSLEMFLYAKKNKCWPRHATKCINCVTTYGLLGHVFAQVVCPHSFFSEFAFSTELLLF